MDYFLTVAASDTSGGAGIQQDISVARDLGYRPLSAVTGITVQDFNRVYAVEAVRPSLLKRQIEQCFRSFEIDVVKIGAICSRDNLKIIADCLNTFSPRHVVLDPVLFSTGGTPFLDTHSVKLLKELLFPIVELVTPNKTEFEILTNRKINSIEEGIAVASVFCRKWNTSLLLKGGHFDDRLIREALVTPTQVYRFERPRCNFTYSHGTGCTLSSALACYLGKKASLADAYIQASKYVVDFFGNLSTLVEG